MKVTKTYWSTAILCCTALISHAQCEVFKSEIVDVQHYMLQVTKLTDSLRPSSEIAAFDARFSTARANSKTVLLLMGQAVTAADEAVLMVSDAQYDSQNCGLAEAMSYTIDAESHAIDARDFASEAFENVKSATKAGNLGNLQFHMRKAQRLIREAQAAADASAIAAEIAHYSCSHDLDHASIDN